MRTKAVFISVVILVALSLATVTSLSRASGDVQRRSFTADPIRTLGHGAFIGPDGETLTLDTDFIRRAQKYYIEALTREASAGRDKSLVGEGEIREKRQQIEGAVQDEILANALLLDWLIEKARPENLAHLTSVNNAMRWYYYLRILQKQAPAGGRWTKGIDPGKARALEESGLPATVLLKTSAGGEAYVKECRAAGVPVPKAMFSSEWTLRGVFDREFISESSQAELWLHTSTSPPGVCLALPRYPRDGGGFSNGASLLGIICLGTQSNKSCFFDNPKGKTFTRGVEVSINEFVGGVDLVANAQGICTDCHAGENPYVVHPEKAPFAGLALLPSGWPAPLVAASWPQNPGPTNLLDAIASPQKCTSCHTYGSAGRFPDVSNQLAGYCGTILENAMDEEILSATPPPDPAKRTMPPSYSGSPKSEYIAHIDALKKACLEPPTGGGVIVDVQFPEDPGFISPPGVIDPLYQCATRLAVRGAILNARVELFINGGLVGSLVAQSTFEEEFTVPALVAGDVVTTRQEYKGAVSAMSAPVIVRDHTADFPGGLPAPTIDPTLIHECGDIIAVRHVPGANLTVFSNGIDPLEYRTKTGWSAVQPAKTPFVIGDSFTAQIKLCSDVSPKSAPQSAVAAPATLPPLKLKPPKVYAGQELLTIENILYGARVSLAEAGFGPISDFSWPVSWYPDYNVAKRMGRPLKAGDRLITSQKLCSAGPPKEIPPALPCADLPAPRIRHPSVGDDFVVVTDSVPGARIRVYDGSGKELGDGSGTVILLRRAITGADTITVVQQVGDCTSRTGYRVSVRNNG